MDWVSLIAISKRRGLAFVLTIIMNRLLRVHALVEFFSMFVFDDDHEI